jgi:hypothetical protein
MSTSRKLIALLVIALAAGAIAFGLQEGSDKSPKAPDPTVDRVSGLKPPLKLINAHDRVVEGNVYPSVSITKSSNITIRGLLDTRKRRRDD